MEPGWLQTMESGLVELWRKLQRAFLRAWILHAEQRLSRAEVHLGRLGWQQATYSPEIQPHADRIDQFEKQQAELLNLAAEQGNKIATLGAEKDEKRALFTKESARLAEELKPVAASLSETGKAIERTAVRWSDASLELARLKKEDGPLAKRLKAAQANPSELPAIAWIPVRREGIASRIKETQQVIDLCREEMKKLRANRKSGRREVRDKEKAMRRLQREWRAEDRKLARQIRGERAEKRRVERKSRQFEEEKAHPFRLVGRALADGGVAPINQPEALQDVRKARTTLALLKSRVEASMKASAAENPRALRLFYMTALALLALLAVGVVFFRQMSL